MVNNRRNPWGKLDFDLCRRLGDPASIFYAFLMNTGKIRKKDTEGFFELETTYVHEKLGWSKWKIIRARSILEDDELIEFRAGLNQNTKNKYKIN